MSILVLGGSGQLGSCLKKVAEKRGFEDIVFPEEGVGNILDTKGLKTLFDLEQPDYVINCAAYTAVDKAEDDVDLCRKVNRDGAENIARLCEATGAKMIHISTDFVFEGNSVAFAKETDAANPISIYGLTKLEGEQVVAELLDEHYIIRTSWLYSEFGNNFVKTMLKLGAERDELNIIVDQVGTPTYAIDLAGAILDIIKSGKTEYGIYHYSNEGVTSWYDFAKGIFDLSNTEVNVFPIPTSQYPTRAVRPKFSVMDKTKYKNTFSKTIPYWRDSLEQCIGELLKN